MSVSLYKKKDYNVFHYVLIIKMIGGSIEVRNEVEKRMQLAFEHIADSSSSNVKFIHRSKDKR